MLKPSPIRIARRINHPVLLVFIGLAVLAASLLYLANQNRKRCFRYGELIVQDVPSKTPMPGIRIRAPGGGWTGSLRVKFKNGMAYLAEKRGVDATTIARFKITDEERRAQLMDHFRAQIALLDQANRILSPKDPLAQRVSKLASPHRNELGELPLSVKIYDSAGLEAFSSPDGSIRFDKGVLTRLDDNEIRAIFGHELGHIVLAHKATQTEWDDGIKFFLVDAPVSLKKWVDKLISANLSKDHEFGADEFSFNWALHHGYDLQAHHTLFGKLSDRKPAPGYPCMDERAKRIHKLVIKHQPKKPFRLFGV